MPRKKRDNKAAPGRPQKLIDWDKVDLLLESGCPGTEIAPHFNMNVETFYDRCFKEKGVGFTDYSGSKKDQGISNIRLQQYLKALGRTKQGDTTLLIHLGKHRLDQKESTTIEVDKALQDNIDNVLISFKAKQEAAKPKEVENGQSAQIDTQTEPHSQD